TETQLKEEITEFVDGTVRSYTSNLIEYTDENGDSLGKKIEKTFIGENESIIEYYDSNNEKVESLDLPETTFHVFKELHYNLNFKGDMTGRIHLNNSVLGEANVSLTNTNLYLGKDEVLNGNNLTLNSGYLSMINNQVGISALNKMTVEGTTNFSGDVDLKNQTMDRFTANEYGIHNGNINVVGMNILTDAPKDRKTTAIYFAQPGLKNNVTNGIPNGEVPQAEYQQATVYSPIYKYNVIYDNKNQYNGLGDGGYFVFTRGNGGSNDPFNPAVLTTPVNTVAAAQAGMTEAFKYVFEHLDAFTQLPAVDRLSKVNANKYAIVVESPYTYNGVSTDYNGNKGSFNYDESNKAYWLRPYVTFESMNLKNGPKVDAITYGSLVGYDGDFKAMRHGWHRIGTSYLGYTGSHLKYSGADTMTNGGLLGMTETYYKGNFWTALTLSVGASVGETKTMYGKEDYVSLLAGAASKTGYNFEFKEGKYIFQPIMYLSYTFAKTFDYTNAAGVRIEADPAHSLQLHPMLRGVANCKNGWQPYVQLGFVWNALNKSNVTANGIQMPEMSMKPYIEYGVGVQRNWDDKYTAFFQTMVRNGGRKGVALTAGFRWAIGKDIDREIKVPTSDKFAQTPTKTIVKQLSPAQKAALCKTRGNTTITVNRAVLKTL
ncbi:autotransporter outer membrane beta-barrel domain-containing protein, partial [bacterium]|nr:autotransporter outer membrane beta-barrel domain-containing protein [bacterium]